MSAGKGASNPMYIYSGLEPSAPPLSESDIDAALDERRPFKMVEPFQIVSAEAYPVTVIEAPSDHTAGNQHNQHNQRSYNPAMRDPRPGAKEARLQSSILDSKITQGNADGNRIVHEERNAAMRSSAVGTKESAQLDRKIEASNRDNVDDIDAVPSYHLTNNPAADTLPSSTPTSTGGSLSYTDGKHDNEYKLPDYSSTGYQISTYKSIYDDGSGTGNMKYEFQDYKSVYDK